MEIENVREDIMVNQFVYTTGVPVDQARQYLELANWNYEAALSNFFDSAPPALTRQCRCTSHASGPCPYAAPPSNTPATPPNFSDLMQKVSQMQSSHNQSSSSFCNSGMVVDGSTGSSTAASPRCPSPAGGNCGVNEFTIGGFMSPYTMEMYTGQNQSPQTSNASVISTNPPATSHRNPFAIPFSPSKPINTSGDCQSHGIFHNGSQQRAHSLLSQSPPIAAGGFHQM